MGHIAEEICDAGSLGSGEVMQVLIVDDDSAVQRLCRTLLKAEGIESIVADDGYQGLEVYREIRANVSLVLSDISMPVMTGIEMARKIFEIDPLVKIGFMTGERNANLIPDDLRSVCFVVFKPFRSDQFLDVVMRCLASRK